MGRRADTVYDHDEADPFALKSAKYDCRRSEYNFINEPFFTFSADNANVIRLETFNQAFLTSFNVRASERRGGKRISLPADLLSHVTTAMIDPGRPGETGE